MFNVTCFVMEKMNVNNFSEHTEQVNLVNWARKQGIFIFSVPNGFKSSAKACVMMKQEGLLSGVPDLIACFPNGKAVFLEMKVQGGVVSIEQKKVHKQLQELGFDVYVCWSCFEAVKFLKKYLTN